MQIDDELLPDNVNDSYLDDGSETEDQQPLSKE